MSAIQQTQHSLRMTEVSADFIGPRTCVTSPNLIGVKPEC